MKTITRILLVLFVSCCSFAAHSQCVPGTASFTDSIMGTNVSVLSTTTPVGSGSNYAWSLDGTIVQQANPNTGYQYQNLTPGTHKLCLFFYINTFLCDSACKYVTIANPCGTLTAYFYSSTSHDTVNFISLDTNSRASHYWTFGDGSYTNPTSTTLSHVYTAPGTYTVCFHAYFPGTGCNDSMCRSVTIAGSTCGTAGFQDYQIGDTIIHAYSNSTGTDSTSRYTWNIRNSSTGVLVQTQSGSTNYIYSHSLPPATYSICLFLYHGTAFCDSICQSITLTAPVNCGTLTAYFYSSTSHDTVNFISLDTNSRASHYWTFGDGSYTNPTSTTLSHVYTAPGTYTVCFHAYIPGIACNDSMCRQVTIAGTTCGTASFTDYQVGDTIIHAFSNSTGVDSTYYYTWNIRNSTGGLVQTQSGRTNYILSHSLAPGTYTICLLLSHGSIFCDSVCHSITLTAPANCGTLTAYWYSTTSHDTVNFTSLDTSRTAYHYWTFGDGSYTYVTSTGTTHVYANPGTYTVCFHAYVSGSACNDSMCRTVTIAGPAPCSAIAAFSLYQIGDTSIHAYSTSTGVDSATIYDWIIRRYTSGVIVQTQIGSSNNIRTGSLNPGTYQVCLLLYHGTPTFCDSICHTITLSAGVNCGSLTPDWTSVSSRDSVYFVATDTNTTAHHIWNFGDGTSTSGSTTVSHVYATAGTYHVCFYAYIPGSSCTDSLCRSVTVGSAANCGTLTAYWNSVTAHDTVGFVAYDTLSSAHHYWNFGDGTYGTGTTATHIYANTGTYHVCFYAYIPGTTCTDSFCRTVTITSTTSCGTASFQYYIYGDTSIHAYSSSTGVGTNEIYAWKVTNLATGNVVYHHSGTTNYLYTSSLPNGTYSVCLSLYNGAGAFCDSVCHDVTISYCAGLTADWSSVTSGDTVKFAAVDTNRSAHHIWNFGDGTSGSGNNETHVYPAAGTYHVCFYAYIPGSTCTDSLCKNIVITNPVNCGTLTAGWRYTTSHDTVNFVAADTNTTAHHIWNFGDGNSVYNTTDPSHVYANYGVYHVCLYTYFPGTNCIDSLCQNITIGSTINCGNITSAFTYSQSGTTVSFVTSDTSTVAHHVWTFGDGSYTYGTTTTHHTYTAAGTYTACLHTYIPGTTCSDSTCVTITISTPCIGLSAAWTPVYLTNGSVQFIPADTASGVYHYWHFGDGSVSTNMDPVHSYAQSGTYRVCQYVYTNTGSNCMDSFCTYIQVTRAGTCQAAFSYTLLSTPNGVQFSNLSTSSDSIVSYRWYFGDTASSTAINPTHTYPHDGTFYACLYITTAGGCNSRICDSVHVVHSNPCGNLTAAWHYYLRSGSADSVTFYGSTANPSGTVNYWTFGDGTTGSHPYLTHVYAHSGTYTVCHYVSIPGTTCTDSSCQTIVIGSTVHCGTASFHAAGNSTGIVAYSTSTGVDSTTVYVWTISETGGVVIQTQSGHSRYLTSGTLNSGTYTVCLSLYASNNTFCDSTCQSVTVGTGNPCTGLDAAYTYSYTSAGGVHFIPASTSITVYNHWTFGDGTSSTTADPTHYYTRGGLYTVCHIVSIPGSTCVDTSCQSIQGSGVGGTCLANFTFTSTGTTAVFTNTSTSTDSIVAYSWSFGDGSNSTSGNTHHTYSAAGAYQVCLTITSANGCTNTYCDSVHVGHNSTSCAASFTYTFDSCNVVAFTNTSTGGFIRVKWYFGDGTSDSTLNPMHIFAAGTYHVYLIISNTATGCSATHTETITVQPCTTTVNDTVCGVVFSDLNGNGVQDAGEPGIAGAEVHIGSYVVHADSNGHYVIAVPAGTYYIYYCAPTGYTFSIPVNSTHTGGSIACAGYQSVTISSGSNCGFNFGIINNSVTICGLVFFDSDSDGVFNASTDAGIANIPVRLVDSLTGAVYTAYTDQYGHYCAVVPAGNYTITISVTTYAHATIRPSSLNVAATTSGQTYSNNDFSVYTQPGICDLAIDITPNTDITPGYPAWYQIQVCNVGSNTTSGNVNLFYDPSLRFNYASPAVSSQNSSTFTASWVLNNLLPGSCQYYYVSLTADSSVVPGQFIFTLADVTTIGCTDANLNNNVDTLHQNATASWDPNNKQVYPAGTGPMGLIAGTEELLYTVNFQNVGNAPAVNVVVHDSISTNLDIETFHVVGASHPYTMQFTGRTAMWKFNGIMLPDSATDQQASHGFVRYAIKPLTSLAKGTQITNTADIFFDYNDGVWSNTTLNTIDVNVSVKDIEAGTATITLQPNPFSQYTVIKIQGAEAPYQMIVYDVLGNIVRNETAGDNIITIQRGSLASGMYIYEVQQKGKVIGKGKMIAQ